MTNQKPKTWRDIETTCAQVKADQVAFEERTRGSAEGVGDICLPNIAGVRYEFHPPNGKQGRSKYHKWWLQDEEWY